MRLEYGKPDSPILSNVDTDFKPLDLVVLTETIFLSMPSPHSKKQDARLERLTSQQFNAHPDSFPNPLFVRPTTNQDALL